VATLEDVDGDPEVVDGQVDGQGSKDAAPDGRELADQADGEACACFALLQP